MPNWTPVVTWVTWFAFCGPSAWYSKSEGVSGRIRVVNWAWNQPMLEDENPLPCLFAAIETKRGHDRALHSKRGRARALHTGAYSPRPT